MTTPRDQILALWRDDPFMEDQALDYGQIADMTGLGLVTVVTTCRALVAEGTMVVDDIEEPT